MLGVKRILRIGTCGGLQPDLKLGDLIVAVSAVPQDATAIHYLVGESHTPTADWELVHGAVHAAKELGKPVRVGPIVSSDIFYDPDKARASAGPTAASSPSRWRPPCSSPSARCAGSRRAASSRSATSWSRASSCASRTRR